MSAATSERAGTAIAVGDRIGRLTVMKEAPKRGSHAVFECRCSCGNTEPLFVRVSDLRRRTRSCGCTSGAPRKEDGIDRGYTRAHYRVYKANGAASEHHCIDCDAWADGWSYVRGCPAEHVGPITPSDPDSPVAPYCQHIGHYQPRCRSCHGRLDRARRVTVRQVRARMLTSL